MKAVLALLALLATGASAAPDAGMTLAEANRLPPAELAKKLLGMAGESRDYVEKRVWGDSGGKVASPGLNTIDLYERPRSAGFEGLCLVEGVSIYFDFSRTPGDPPHRVRDFDKVKRYLLIHPTAQRNADADYDRLKRECPGLTPVAERTAPTPFSVTPDSSAHAYFAMRAVAKAAKAGVAVHCTRGRFRPDARLCRDPKAEVAALPLDGFFVARIDRCGAYWCVEAVWRRGAAGNEEQLATLKIVTDSTIVDPPGDFRVTGLALRHGIIIYD